MIRVLLGFLKVSGELSSLRIAYGPDSLPVITVPGSHEGANRTECLPRRAAAALR